MATSNSNILELEVGFHGECEEIEEIPSPECASANPMFKSYDGIVEKTNKNQEYKPGIDRNNKEYQLMIRMAKYGLVMLLLSLCIGVMFGQGVFGHNVERVAVNKHTALVDPALQVKPWETGASFVEPCALLLVMHLVLKACSTYVEYHYQHLDVSKKKKCAIYIFEVFMCSFTLAWSSFHGMWQCIFFPGMYEPMTPQKSLELARGLMFQALVMFFMYVIEMESDPDMRPSLKLHHFVTCLLLLLVGLVIFQSHGALELLRISLVVTLYTITEQNVFITMLAYRSKAFQYPALYLVSAVYYLLTRIAISAAALWLWIDAATWVWSEQHHSWCVYSLWLLFPGTNLILNMIQVQTSLALFSLALRIKKINKMQRACEFGEHKKMLIDNFLNIESDSCAQHTGNMIDEDDFLEYIDHSLKQSLLYVYPADTFSILFNAMSEGEEKGDLVSMEHFVAHMMDVIHRYHNTKFGEVIQLAAIDELLSTEKYPDLKTHFQTIKTWLDHTPIKKRLSRSLSRSLSNLSPTMESLSPRHSPVFKRSTYY